jgi:hypothetical protein
MSTTHRHLLIYGASLGVIVVSYAGLTTLALMSSWAFWVDWEFLLHFTRQCGRICRPDATSEAKNIGAFYFVNKSYLCVNKHGIFSYFVTIVPTTDHESSTHFPIEFQWSHDQFTIITDIDGALPVPTWEAIDPKATKI